MTRPDTRPSAAAPAIDTDARPDTPDAGGGEPDIPALDRAFAPTVPTDLDWLRAAGAAADRRLAADRRRAAAADAAPEAAAASVARPRPGPPLPDPTPEQMQRHLRTAHRVAGQALAAGHHPFGALLVGPDHETVLMEQGNLDTVNHAEAVLLRMASRAWSADELWGCTLYTTVEPCCMCAGTQYWANVGRLVYGMDERRLAAFTGAHPENPTLDLPSRRVFQSGQKGIRVWGPVPEVEAEIAALHAEFWKRDAG